MQAATDLVHAEVEHVRIPALNDARQLFDQDVAQGSSPLEEEPDWQEVPGALISLRFADDTSWSRAYRITSDTKLALTVHPTGALVFTMAIVSQGMVVTEAVSVSVLHHSYMDLDQYVPTVLSLLYGKLLRGMLFELS